MGKLRENFGKKIRKLRKSRGFTQESFAERVSLEPTYLGGVERGERNLTIDNIEKIIKGFDIEAYRLFLFHPETEIEKTSFTQEQIADILDSLPEEKRKKILQIIALCS